MKGEGKQIIFYYIEPPYKVYINGILSNTDSLGKYQLTSKDII